MSYIDFNDDSIPIGKRKQAFVKWLMQRQGLSLDEAKLAAHRKFEGARIQQAWAEERWARQQNRHYFRGRG